jgi:hypothetical protein
MSIRSGLLLGNAEKTGVAAALFLCFLLNGATDYRSGQVDADSPIAITT